jgi:tRNA A-37 threonylcarbamoyl transferase component Bud32
MSRERSRTIVPRSRLSRKKIRSASSSRKRKGTKRRYGGIGPRPALSLNIAGINKDNTDVKLNADKKRQAQTEFFKNKELDQNAIDWIQQAIIPLPSEEIPVLTESLGEEIKDGNKHVSSRQLLNGIHEFNTRVFLHKDDPTKVIKLYEYENDSLDVVFAYEAYIQDAAYKISHDCGVQIPEVYAYGKYIPANKGGFCFFIVMQKIDFVSLHEYLTKNAVHHILCEGIARKINEVNDCLNQKGIRHGDLNVGNIFINSRPDANRSSDNSLDIALIDFGQAGPSSPINHIDENYSCDKIINLSKRLKSSTISPSGGFTR